MQRIYFTLLIAVLFSVSACVHDKDGTDTAGSTDEKKIVLHMAIPGNHSGTRAIGATQENIIYTVDVLAFKIDGSSETFDYSATGYPETSNTPGGATQTFTAALHTKTYPQRFVIITNARAEVGALLGSSVWGGADKQTMLARLKFVMPEGADRWNAASPADFTAMPMWGESGAETIASSTTQLSGSINLMRMIARIDVQLDTDIAGLTDKFKLKSVHLYNTNTGGQIVPSADAVTQEDRNGIAYLYVTAPSIPTEMQPYNARYPGPVNYTDFSAPGIADIAMTGAIYTFEADTVADESQATCIVVGGVYGSDTDTTYYRLDFVAADGSTKLDILRNHRYAVNITDATGSGHSTADEAFLSKSVNMTAEILRWNEAGMGNIVFDGSNTLAVSRDTLNLYKDAYTATSTRSRLTVFTDYTTPSSGGTSGWTVEKIVDAATGAPVNWLSMTPALGVANERTNTVVTYSENTTGASRSAVIWIAAGRLRYPLIVNQSTEEMPKQANFTIDCSNITVSGLYMSNVPLNSTNTMSVVMTATPASIGTPYMILTNIQNGYSFSATGTVTSIPQTITLRGSGTPAVSKVDTFTFLTNSSGRPSLCTQNIRVIPRTVKIIGLGGVWYNVGNNRPVSGTVDMVMNKVIHNTAYFGPGASAVCPVGGVIISKESNGQDWRPSATQLRDTINKYNPDIIIGGYQVGITAAHMTVFQNFINKGGVLIYIYDEGETVSKQLVDNLFYNGTSTVTMNTGETQSQSGGPTMPWTNANHPILHGPFLNLSGGGTTYYVQQDGDSNGSISVNGTSNIANATVLVNNPAGTGARVFVHNTKGLVWVGDGGALAGASDQLSATTRWPVKVVNQSPYGTLQIGASGSSGNNAYTTNAHFFANSIAWAIGYVQTTRPTGSEAYNLP